jgi:HAD superfamily hydrolase (TIGR01490 family)
MVKLAIFDVDYTLTKRETLFELYLYLFRRKPSIIKHFPSTLKAAFFYLFKIYDAGKAKESFISFIDGIDEKEMQNIVKDFYEKRLSKIIYKDAYDTMKKLKSEGCLIYLISASAEFYLHELYNIKEVDKVIGTKFRLENGVYKGIIEGKNCKGDEKVKRLMEVIEEKHMEVDFKNSYMFSDSLSDMPLFKLVGHPYLINARKKRNNIEVLRWK